MSMSSSLITSVSAALKRTTNWRALVVGDCMIDDFTFCDTKQSKEISSEMPGKRAYRAVKRVVALGGAANVAANLRALGAATSLIGVVGRDGYDKALTHECDAHGIRASFATDPQRPTTVKRRIYLDDEYFFRIDQELATPVTDEISDRLIREAHESIPDVDVVIISDYAKGVITPKVATAIKELTDRWDVPLVIDTKPGQIGLFAGCDLVIPNLIEAKDLLPHFAVDEALPTYTKELLTKIKTGSIAVTLGGHGMCGIRNGEYTLVPGFTVNVRDTVGAGDTVRAAVALGLVLQLPFAEVLTLANAAGAVVVQKVGTATASREEVLKLLQTQSL